VLAVAQQIPVDPVVGRLADRADRYDRSNMPPRTLAQRYVEEGLRMDEHPLIRFADFPADGSRLAKGARAPIRDSLLSDR
jgi:hypothetical protein